jgi:RHS repeat-associated protein
MPAYCTAKISATVSEVIDYVNLEGQLVAERMTPLFGGLVATRYQHADMRGSPTVVTNAGCTQIERSIEQPFGAPYDGIYRDGPGFTGHATDAASGLTYMQQRYYDPIAMRFLSVDPAQSEFNRYSYGANNPFKFVDPDGRVAQAVEAGIVAAVVGCAKNAGCRSAVKAGLSGAGKSPAIGTPGVIDASGVKGYESTNADQAGNDSQSQAATSSTGAKRGPKTDPEAPHNRKIREVGNELVDQKNEIVAGGGVKPERSVDTPGGFKSTRRPDITYKTPGGETKAINVGRTKADGSPVTREVKAMQDLNGSGMQTDFVPYD